jgi:hypothetical protein
MMTSVYLSRLTELILANTADVMSADYARDCFDKPNTDLFLLNIIKFVMGKFLLSFLKSFFHLAR